MGKKTIVFVGLCLLFNVSDTWSDTFPYHESFESGMGRWEQGPEHDFEWTRHSGPTWSWWWYAAWYSWWNTGPDGAHDQDWFVYARASGHSGDAAILQAEFDISSLENPMMTVRYHMYGASTGKLWVEVFDNGSWIPQFPTKDGQQHDAHDDPWDKGEVAVNFYTGTTNLKVRIRTEMGTGWNGDICIDDIWIYENTGLPHHFEWSPIDDPQKGVPFPVQIEAVDSLGQRVTSFNEAVKLFAWSDGVLDAGLNGDFSQPLFARPESNWSPINPDPNVEGSYHRAEESESIFGTGRAFEFEPHDYEDGLWQEVSLIGGEDYTISVSSALENSGVPITSFMTCRIEVDGTVIDAGSISSLSSGNWYPFFLAGTFTPPTNGIYTLKLIATTSAEHNEDLSAYFDNVSVNYAPAQHIVADPGTSGAFSSGVWSGDIMLNSRLAETKLIARYADATGESELFSTYTPASDKDGDGLLDSWETIYFDTAEDCVPSVDTDGDGYSNAEEYFLGTIPTDMDSSLNLLAVACGSSGCSLTWSSVEGRTYDVEWAPSLPPSFTTIANIPHPQGSFTNGMAGSESQGYYRLKVRKK